MVIQLCQAWKYACAEAEARPDMLLELSMQTYWADYHSHNSAAARNHLGTVGGVQVWQP
jgi:hypothetical protein